MTQTSTKKLKAPTFGSLKAKILRILSGKRSKMRRLTPFSFVIPDEVAKRWLIGRTVCEFSKKILESIVVSFKQGHGKTWKTEDLIKMCRVYMRYQSADSLAGACWDQMKGGVTLDQLLSEKDLKTRKLFVRMEWGGSENKQWMMNFLRSRFFLMNFPDCGNINKYFQDMDKKMSNRFLITIRPIGKETLGSNDSKEKENVD